MANDRNTGKIPGCVAFVEALHDKEVRDIISCDDNKHLYAVVAPHVVRDFPEGFLWKDDLKVMKGIKEACSGPYKFLVLFFKNEELKEATAEATIGSQS